jgi:hypothetical protein
MNLKVRQLGQVWTPEVLADVMAAWTSRPERTTIDPSAGSGNLLRAAKRRGAAVRGYEIDSEWVRKLRLSGFDITEADFLKISHLSGVDWICNPPYVRHRLIPPAIKSEVLLQARRDGLELRGTVGLHAYFIYRIISYIRAGDRAAFLIPSDIFEGSSAPNLFSWMLERVRFEAVLLGQRGCGVFDSLDVRPLLLLVEGRFEEKRSDEFCYFSSITAENIGELKDRVTKKNWENTLVIGSGRYPPWLQRPMEGARSLGDIATVMRGLVPGHADWFLHTRSSLRQIGLDEGMCRRIIRRASDFSRNVPLTDSVLDELDARGIPTFLISPPAERVREDAFREHILKGQLLGLHEIPSLRNRRPWWKSEKRLTPPWLYSYFGSPTSDRFVRNLSSAAPLMGHLCIYPKPGCEEELNRVLSHPNIADGIPMVSKCYGKSYKTEPRSLMRLPLPL